LIWIIGEFTLQVCCTVVGANAPRQAVIVPATGTKVPAARRELGPFTRFQLTTTPESIPASRSHVSFARCTMDAPSAQLHQGLRDAVTRELLQRRPLLHHLNADTSWLLQLPRPAAAAKRGGRVYYNILIDPWLAGGQSDVAKWFSQQWHATESKVKSIAEVEELAREIEILAEGLRLGRGREKSVFGSDVDIKTFIDAVAISHEFTDHCHKETLLDIDPDVPVFATNVGLLPIPTPPHTAM